MFFSRAKRTTTSPRTVRRPRLPRCRLELEPLENRSVPASGWVGFGALGEVPVGDSVVPASPATTDVIRFTLYTDTYSDPCWASRANGGSPTLSFDVPNRTIVVTFVGPPSPPEAACVQVIMQGLRGELSSLDEGEWTLRGPVSSITFTVGDQGRSFEEPPSPATSPIVQPPSPIGPGPFVSTVAGDAEIFALDKQGQLWRRGVSGASWMHSASDVLQVAVSNVGDGNANNDVVFLRSADSKIRFWNGAGWQFSGGWLPDLSAGDDQVFAIGFDGQLWQFHVHNGWTASGGWGVEIAVASKGDGIAANDLVFLRGADSSIWVWTQHSWSFTGGWLPGLTAGDDQIFGIGVDGQLWHFHVQRGWTASGGRGVDIDVANADDGNAANDMVFLRGADNAVWLWTQNSWQFTGGWLAHIAAGKDRVVGLNPDGRVWQYQVQHGWSSLSASGLHVQVGPIADPTNELMFHLASSRALWTWDQASGTLGAT